MCMARDELFPAKVPYQQRFTTGVDVAIEGNSTQDDSTRTYFTGIWQGSDLGQIDWLRDIFGDNIKKWIFDQTHSAVLDDSILFDRYVNSHDPGYYRRFSTLNAFIVDLADENYDSKISVYRNFKGVLRCYWSGVFREDAVWFIPLGTQTKVDEDVPLTRSNSRSLVWSFLGALDKSSRPDMVKGLSSVEPHLLFGTDSPVDLTMWNRSTDGPRRYTAEQAEAILRDSIFAPSPIGNFNIECWRVYEALACGAIPIVEKRASLDYYKGLWGEHPVPTVSSWREGKELIDELLIDPAKLDVLQKEVLDW